MGPRIRGDDAEERPADGPDPSLTPSEKVPVRPIILLAVAGFASQAMVRVTDSLLPQIAADFGTTVGAASIVVTAYAVSHGSIQLIIGPIGDRFGKYLTVAIMCAARRHPGGDLRSRPVARRARGRALASGAAAGWIIPLSMAYVGDVTPYDRRQPVLGALSVRTDHRPAVRPGGGRRARRPVRLAQRVLHARRRCSRWPPSG